MSRTPAARNKGKGFGAGIDQEGDVGLPPALRAGDGARSAFAWGRGPHEACQWALQRGSYLSAPPRSMATPS